MIPPSSEPDTIRHAISLRPTPFGHASSDYSPSSSPREREFRRNETSPVASPIRSHHLSFQPSPLHAYIAGQALPAASSAPNLLAVSQGAPGVNNNNNINNNGSSNAKGGFVPTDQAARSTAIESDDGNSTRHRGAGDGNGDLEMQPIDTDARWNIMNDPYNLSKALKTEAEISMIKANTSRKRKDGLAPRVVGKGTGQKIETFYKDQNQNIERLLKPVDDHRKEAKDTIGENQLRFKIAVHGSFIANVILAALQTYAAASSGSLSLFTTMADALFDPLSNITLIVSARAINRVDGRKFPSGKARIETAANIAFCFIMTAVSLIIIVQSIRDLVEGSTTKTTKFFLASTIAVAVAFFVKLGLFLYCFSIRKLFSQVQILWEDHRNDLIVNGFGLMFSLLGSHVRWWIDPMGAIMISCLIIFLWLRTAHSEFLLLIGLTAEPEFLRHVTYIAMTHSDDIKAIDTVRAYYSGPRLIVEVDIVMDANDSLQSTHDVAEDLQIKLESLPDVERAYVHVDYETSHAPEHFLKKEL